jgi:hypothetical protein
MRKALSAISIAAIAATLATPSLAEPIYHDNAAPAAGAVGGTVAGLGLTEGWWGAAPAVAGTAVPTTVAGAAAVGGVAGIGGAALIDAAIQPCRGFQAMFLMNEEYCAEQNARHLAQRERVAYSPHATYHHGRRVHHYYR